MELLRRVTEILDAVHRLRLTRVRTTFRMLIYLTRSQTRWEYITTFT